MTKRKRPAGKELEDWCRHWDESNHNGKLALCQKLGVTYDTGKHIRSECGIPIKTPPTTPVISEPRVNVPLHLRTKGDIATVAIVGDFHHPYQDNRVVAVVEDFLGTIQPDYLIYNGDVNDFYQVSVFAKDPTRLGSLQSDIDVTTNMFKRHDALLPNTKKIFVEGTHENRWFKYLQQQAPAVSALHGNTISELYKLADFDIDYVPFERGVLINHIFLVLHGDIVSAHSSYTAKRHYEKHGGCGMCNHTHRGGSYYKRDRFGVWGWWENFCLCRLDPDWVQNPDWVQGFSLVHFDNKDRFWVEQIPIINSMFIYGGKVYK